MDLRPRQSVMLEQLAALVEIESGSSDIEGIKGCALAIEKLAHEVTGAKAQLVHAADGRMHLVWRLGTSATKVLLVGHFDTVWPSGTLARWPFSVDRSDERATGPGAFDMKAGIVQMFHALAALSEVASTDGVTCVLTSDEELGSQTSRQLIEELASGATAALVMEPSADGGALKLARKGTSMYEVAVQGRAAHAGLEPEKGVNATVELAHQVLAINRLGRPDAGTTVTPTVAVAGTTTNTVPAHAVVHVDVRAESREEQDRVDRAIRALHAEFDGAGLAVSGGPNRAPFSRDSSAGLFALAERAAGDLGLGKLSGVAVGGGSDGNFTAGMGVATLDGLGAVGGNAHGEGEWVHVPSMPERAALVAELVRRLLEPDHPGL